MPTLLITLFLCLAASTVVPHVGPIESRVPPTYKVQIDDSPEKRWAPIIKHFMEPLHRVAEFLNLLPVPKTFYDGVEWYAKNEFQHQDFVREVDAIAKLSGLPFEKVFFINFAYQYSTFRACTAILVRTDQGKVIHGRNLDFQMWELISKLLANIEYYRGDTKIYTSDTVVGTAFALTAIRHGAFTLNVDTRYAKHFTDDLISIIKNNAIPTVWLLRKVVEEEETYATAVKRLKSERIGGPVYYIVSGIHPNEGIVIEREVDSVHAYYELSDSQWFIVQTNYDRDEPEPVIDPRRIPVEKKMRQRGNKNFNEDTLMKEFMSQWPTFNIGTIMTAVMVAESGYHNNTAWYGFNPPQTAMKLTSE